jgi:50S ribosomal protein L16 3-hydroxylase
MQRMAEEAEDVVGEALYSDAGQPAVANPGAIPASLQDFAQTALRQLLDDPQALQCALGEVLTEPKAHVWFDAAEPVEPLRQVALDPRTRMFYDDHHIFINGESYRAAGRDATLMRRLADERQLDAKALARASADAQSLLLSWCASGWVQAR